MMKILENKKSTQKITPHYMLTINYMIGDADGDTQYSSEVRLENPYIERFLTLIDNLPQRPGHWGLSLDNACISDLFKHKLLSEDDYKFLCKFMPKYGEYDDIVEPLTDEEYEDFDAISSCIRSDVEYSFLTYESYELDYYDENGTKFNTEIVNDK